MVSTIPRLVLDTNACLDLFVFNDRVGGPLRALLESNRALAVTDAVCRAEWQRVLRYRHLAFEAERIAVAEAAFDALVVEWPAGDAAAPLGSPAGLASQVPTAAAPDTTAASAASPIAASPPLPRCKDPDDQKFLELAARCAARVLVTRDDSLLRLSRRGQAVAGFIVLPPLAAVALLEQASPPV
ncbi:MAG: putative toxin-antitoxin system toxin component, PIN family [Pseudomonadota bacterium]|jgi:predicted nucleic acid-binding protein